MSIQINHLLWLKRLNERYAVVNGMVSNPYRDGYSYCAMRENT